MIGENADKSLLGERMFYIRLWFFKIFLKMAFAVIPDETRIISRNSQFVDGYHAIIQSRYTSD